MTEVQLPGGEWQLEAGAQSCLNRQAGLMLQREGALSITNSRSLPKRMSIELVMPSSHLILSSPSPPAPIPSSIRVFSSESILHMRWPKYWSFSISPFKEHPGLISFRIDWLISLQLKGISRVFSNTTVQKHQFFSAQPSSQSNSHIHT